MPIRALVDSVTDEIIYFVTLLIWPEHSKDIYQSPRIKMLGEGIVNR